VLDLRWAAECGDNSYFDRLMRQHRLTPLDMLVIRDELAKADDVSGTAFKGEEPPVLHEPPPAIPRPASPFPVEGEPGSPAGPNDVISHVPPLWSPLHPPPLPRPPLPPPPSGIPWRPYVPVPTDPGGAAVSMLDPGWSYPHGILPGLAVLPTALPAPTYPGSDTPSFPGEQKIVFSCGGSAVFYGYPEKTCLDWEEVGVIRRWLFKVNTFIRGKLVDQEHPWDAWFKAHLFSGDDCDMAASTLSMVTCLGVVSAGTVLCEAIPACATAATLALANPLTATRVSLGITAFTGGCAMGLYEHVKDIICVH
jgi:hypothetical protein